MSAYVVEDETISVIVRAFEIYNAIYEAENYTPSNSWLVDLEAEREAVGQSLLDYNYKSVNFRYEEDETTPKFKYKDVDLIKDGVLNVGLIYGCIKCYEYQTCEVPNWYTSELFYALRRLKDAMLERFIKNQNQEISWGYRD